MICSGVYKPFPFPFNASCKHQHLLISGDLYYMSTNTLCTRNDLDLYPALEMTSISR